MASDKKNNKIELLDGSVFDTLKKMTIPMTYGMILLMAFNLVDTFFVSLLGTQPLAAISFTFPITFAVISLGIGLGIGTSAIVAKLLGKADHCAARLNSTVSIYLGAALIALLAFIGYLFIDPIFTTLGATPPILLLIHEYMDIWFLGAVFLVGPMVGNAILRSAGDTKTPSFIMGAAGLINAILDPILIFGFGPIPAMEMQGAAIATLISWACATFIVLYILVVKQKLIESQFPKIKDFISASRQILKIGLPAAGANILTPVAAAILTAIVATYGEYAVAAFGVGSRIESIACLVIFALSMTLPPFISQNFGASKMHRVIEAYKTSVKFVLLWQLVIYGVLVIFARHIAKVFADDPNVIDTIVLFIWVLPLVYGLQGVIILTNSSLNALHRPMTTLVLSIIRLFVFYIPMAYIGSLLFDITGFFVGAALGIFFMSIVSYYFFTRQFNSQMHPLINNKTKEDISL